MSETVKLGLRIIKPEVWSTIIEFCRSRDVEEGDGDEYMYSVRRSTGALTIWTRRGWRESFYVAQVHPVVKAKGLQLMFLPGTGPADRNWQSQKVERHLSELVARLLPNEKPL